MKQQFLLLFMGLFTFQTVSALAQVELDHGTDESAGGGSAYIVTTPAATYYLEKEGGGLSSVLDRDGVDWLGFHAQPGSGWRGEYRGFPNAIHRQDGNYFHAMNAGTDPSSSVVDVESPAHVRITFTSDNGKWQGQWDFYADRCDFTMSRVSPGYRYWVQYEGVPGGEMDVTDYWYASVDTERHPIEESHIGDLPAPEWMAFGDASSPRMLYVLHHEDDDYPDDYVSRPYMTVLGFGRREKGKYLDTVETFSIGFVESTKHAALAQAMEKILDTQ
ncbi:hypothetical protein EY643_05740 [Halioglobus maricola]|uniref:PEP-CTERM sorting domain-containing protein n=1 Tax=Halioglobus maricola TaxID=2601894 RepID=A0A5P9NHB8_9GAMM|nr:hypothetical protein [Halioglobus maricola]QFU75191.1 hypothetical protein EY643_05740 [Halioglobus maricola]